MVGIVEEETSPFQSHHVLRVCLSHFVSLALATRERVIGQLVSCQLTRLCQDILYPVCCVAANSQTYMILIGICVTVCRGCLCLCVARYVLTFLACSHTFAQLYVALELDRVRFDRRFPSCSTFILRHPVVRPSCVCSVTALTASRCHRLLVLVTYLTLLIVSPLSVPVSAVVWRVLRFPVPCESACMMLPFVCQCDVELVCFSEQ